MEMQSGRIGAILMLCLSVCASLVHAQGAYPNRPIKLILPFTAGGTGDGVGRIVAQDMGLRLGQPIFLENQVGGTGIVGQDNGMRAVPDGYTIFVASISGTLAYHFVGRSIDYNKDLAAIGQIYSQYGLLVSNHNLPEMGGINNLRQLVAYSKANPGKLNYASQGTGSIGHLVMEKIKSLTGVDIVHVPYKGAAPAYSDLLAGRIQMMSVSLGALPYIKAGKFRAIAIGSPQRSPVLPDVATFNEEGLTGFVAGSWLGLAAPPATPRDIVNRLSAELKASLANPEVDQKLRALGTDPEFLSGPEFAARATGDFQQWGKVLKENNIKPN